MPWNFPFWQVFRFAAPGLMAGNVGLLKHASNVPGCALAIEEIFRLAGFPAGVFQSLLIGADRVEAVIRHPAVRAVTLTGSEPAGRRVAAVAGGMLKKTVLELGGSDPFIVLRDVDPVEVAASAAVGRCINNGQSCIAAKRFIVHDEVYDRFAEAFVTRMAALAVGDPMDEATDVGPLATEGGLRDVAAMVDDARSKGAAILCGGTPDAGPGWFYPPTVVGDLTPEMAMYADEVFGPVAGLYRVGSVDEAIELGNGTSFGLGSNAWTTDAAEQERFVRDLDAGVVTINGMTVSYPQLPFGGTKRSGYGRELSGYGIKEFCNTKAVWVG
jgi:succinate-semialdehyde dehydrogenase/glutarate-semialdehyde dehydrogenase